MSDGLHICIVGPADFVRRMASAARTPQRDSLVDRITVVQGNLAETRSLALNFRPQMLIFGIGFDFNVSDFRWLNGLLRDLRDRFQKKMYIVCTVASPEKLSYAGSLLFASQQSLEPSGLIDNFIIAPPPGTGADYSIESQLQNCISFAAELFGETFSEENRLPALWEDNWIPAMCDPESRNVWMRWLPRYAQYINENPLILGPTGSGKTRLAAALHQLSGRKGPFVSITPRDFSSTELVQAELFGAVAGAYTGAVEKWGLVRKAEKGTLFVDELQSIDFDLQGKLITFIESKSYRRVGEAESHHADVRFVFATNMSLQKLVEQGRLRDDFAYRLERLQLLLRPLEERRLDISAGIAFALAKVLRERHPRQKHEADDATAEYFSVEGLEADAYRRLFAASWPGNLRQLENTIAKLVEAASVSGRHLIDGRSTEEALQGLLGQVELTSDDILDSALRKVASGEFGAMGERGLEHYLQSLATEVRRIALDRTGGDHVKAASLINDSPKLLEIFSRSHSYARPVGRGRS